LKHKPKIIVITGAESTGKSTLTKALADHFNVPFVLETARDYVGNLDRKYNFQDVVNIAKTQIDALNKLKNSDYPYIFVDTWLIITKIWFEKVFNSTPDWIETEIHQTKVDLFLVCDIDLPWVYDPVRENGGEQRINLHKNYIKDLKEFNFNFRIVSGINDNRVQNALQYLKLLE
jgi:NadR type nicotinamide-nucleotide adenylyltransferase